MPKLSAILPNAVSLKNSSNFNASSNDKTCGTFWIESLSVCHIPPNIDLVLWINNKSGASVHVALISQIKKLADKHPLTQPNKRNNRLGNAIRPKIVRARFVRWPRYVQIQRKKRILLRRLKVPPAIAQFFNPLEKSTTSQLMKILRKYSPETKKQKTDRIKNLAKDQIKQQKSKKGGEKPFSLKYGLNHVTYLVEQKKAKLVLIANDVDPIETVVFLPTLCKSMDIPYAIVHNKARLGELVHKKSAAVVALTDFKDSLADLNSIARVCKEQFNAVETKFKKPEKGIKSIVRERKLQRALLAEDAKKGTA